MWSVFKNTPSRWAGTWWWVRSRWPSCKPSGPRQWWEAQGPSPWRRGRPYPGGETFASKRATPGRNKFSRDFFQTARYFWPFISSSNSFKICLEHQPSLSPSHQCLLCRNRQCTWKGEIKLLKQHRLFWTWHRIQRQTPGILRSSTWPRGQPVLAEPACSIFRRSS